MKKRIFSLLMAVVMLVTFGAIAVSAEDAVVEDVPVEDVPVATGINITKPNLPEYQVTTKVTNNFPTAAKTFIADGESSDPGIVANPSEYAIVGGDFILALDENKATVTFAEDTGSKDLLRILFKTNTLTGANYLTFHIDTTNLSGSAYFNLRLNNIWTVYDLKVGSDYYFLPDVDENNPNPKRQTFVVGDTSFEGFKLPAGVTGTIYIPESSFRNGSSNAEFDNYLQWSYYHNDRQNASLYIENKQEYDGGAVTGDEIVFSDICWVKEESVKSKFDYNAEYLTNTFSSSETGKFEFTSNASGSGWDNWQSPEIGGYFNESFDAVKFDLDYSEFTGNECYMSIRYIFNLTTDGVTVLHRYYAQKTYYIVWENGKVQEIQPNPTWQQGAIQLPSGFKGTVIIPFSSFVDVNGDGLMFTELAEYPKMELWLYRPTSTPATASVDNFGFLTTYKATDLVSARAQIMEEAFEETEKTVDLNGDGKVDAVDIVYLKKIVSWAA